MVGRSRGRSFYPPPLYQPEQVPVALAYPAESGVIIKFSDFVNGNDVSRMADQNRRAYGVAHPFYVRRAASLLS